MELKQDAKKRSEDVRDPQDTRRIRQADRFEVLAAASEAESASPTWIADQLSDFERVST